MLLGGGGWQDGRVWGLDGLVLMMLVVHRGLDDLVLIMLAVHMGAREGCRL